MEKKKRKKKTFPLFTPTYINIYIERYLKASHYTSAYNGKIKGEEIRTVRSTSNGCDDEVSATTERHVGAIWTRKRDHLLQSVSSVPRHACSWTPACVSSHLTGPTTLSTHYIIPLHLGLPFLFLRTQKQTYLFNPLEHDNHNILLYVFI